MPQTKTIAIDEVLPAPSRKKYPSSEENEAPYTTGQSPRASESTDPSFSDSNFNKHWGWKTRTTLLLTQWFLFLRRKPYGKWIIGPVVLLAIILIIPLGLCTLLAIVTITFVKALLGTSPKQRY